MPTTFKVVAESTCDRCLTFKACSGRTREHAVAELRKLGWTILKSSMSGARKSRCPECRRKQT